MGRGEGGGGGAVAVGAEQFGDVALVEVLAQAPRSPTVDQGCDQWHDKPTENSEQQSVSIKTTYYWIFEQILINHDSC